MVKNKVYIVDNSQIDHLIELGKQYYSCYNRNQSESIIKSFRSLETLRADIKKTYIVIDSINYKQCYAVVIEFSHHRKIYFYIYKEHIDLNPRRIKETNISHQAFFFSFSFRQNYISFIY